MGEGPTSSLLAQSCPRIYAPSHLAPRNVGERLAEFGQPLSRLAPNAEHVIDNLFEHGECRVVFFARGMTHLVANGLRHSGAVRQARAKGCARVLECRSEGAHRIGLRFRCLLGVAHFPPRHLAVLLRRMAHGGVRRCCIR